MMTTFDATPLQRQLIMTNDRNGVPYLPAIDAASGKPNDDGTFGTITQAALIRYQNEHDLTASGQPDDPTMISLGLKTKPPAVVQWALPTFSVPAVFSDYVLNWITSKTSWAATAGAVIIVGVLNGWLGRIGIELPDSAKVTVAGILLLLLNGVVVPFLHSVLNRSKVVAGKVALKAE